MHEGAPSIPGHLIPHSLVATTPVLRVNHSVLTLRHVPVLSLHGKFAGSGSQKGPFSEVVPK